MKRKPFALLVILLLPMLAFAQSNLTGADSARLLIDSTLRYAKANSLYRDKEDWTAVTDSMRKYSNNAHTIAEVMPAFPVMYKMLGDFHGQALLKRKSYKWPGRRSKVDHKLYADIINRIRSGSVNVGSHLLEPGYGYLIIPANNPTHAGESDSIARVIQDSLARLDPAKLKGLIIDLRTNTGGDMFPMILGVGNLFTPGELGAFIYKDGKPKEEWHIAGNAFYMAGKKAMEVPKIGKFNPKLKIALLTSPYTASSAEALLTSFIGQKNVRIIGEPTAGYTTANDSFSYLGVQVLMATSVAEDRNGHINYVNILPDEQVILGDDLNDLSKDKKVAAAMKWFKGK